MRDRNRIPALLYRLMAVWEGRPEMRLGQLILNAQLEDGPDLYYLEDEALLTRLETLYGDNQHAER